MTPASANQASNSSSDANDRRIEPVIVSSSGEGPARREAQTVSFTAQPMGIEHPQFRLFCADRNLPIEITTPGADRNGADAAAASASSTFTITGQFGWHRGERSRSE